MIMKKQTFLAFTLCALTAIQVRAAEENLPKTLMTQRGKQLYSDDLSKLEKSWSARPGKWEIADGSLKGTELAENKHPAVNRHQFVFKDAVIQFDVQVNGCKQTTFSINDAKEHLARVLITKDGFTAQKDDHDHQGPDKAVRFGHVAMPFKAGEWKTVLIELKGYEMVVTIDGKTIAGAHELIGTQKANFGFTVSGESAQFRNLHVWEAESNSSWEKTKKQLTATGK